MSRLDKVKTSEVIVALRTKDYNPFKNGLALYVQSEWYDTGANNSDKINRTLAMGIANLEIAEGIILRTRLMGGSSSGALLSYRNFGVGGLGSVSAHPYKVQTGDHFAQGNFEFIITPEFTDSGWQIKLFADGGHAWNKSEYGYEFDKIKSSAVTSFGIGIGRGDDDDLDWMINISQPMNEGGLLQTTLRWNYNF